MFVYRMLAVDNGMALDEGQPRQGRSSADADPTGQGLQWGAAPAAPTTISPTKKKSTAGKAAKEAQVSHATAFSVACYPADCNFHCLPQAPGWHNNS